MIRTILLVIVLTTVFSDLTVKDHKHFQYGSIQLDKVDRIVNLNGAYPEEISKAIIRNVGTDPTKTFYHVVPKNLSKSIADIKFQGATQLRYTQFETSDSYTVFKVDFAQAILRTEFTLTITTRYINRYRNLPKEISMFDDQLLQYTDYRYFYSPYKVNQQTVIYKFNKLISAKPQPSSLEYTSAKYSEASIIQPFNKDRVVVHGQNNIPQMVYTEVHKTIQISHWGNIAIAQKYSILNKGPSLKGQFSRVEYNPYNENAGKNAFKKTIATLPYEAWGLYYRDEVGNISTSRAYRDSRSNNVKFQIQPRFGIFGGWKSNWEIGYNLPTQGFLLHDKDHFQLSSLPLGYELDRVIAEKFSFTVILPQGATNIKLSVNGQDIKYKTDVSFSFLDFIGRPSISFERGVSAKDIQSNFKLTYDFTSKSLLRKPFLLFVTLFSIFVLIIIAGRLQLKTLHIQKY